MRKFVEALRRPAAALLGVVLLISGILKMMDPVGTGLIVEEYFQLFHLGFLRPCAKVFGVGLSLLESICGSALIAGLWRKVVLIIAGALTIFFTIVTLILLIANPNMDCGCFGLVVHLSHLQSFLKNLVLLACWGLAFVPPVGGGKQKLRKYISFGISATTLVVFAIFSLSSLPLVDRTEFGIGAEIGEDGVLLSISDKDGIYHDELVGEGSVMIVSFYGKHKKMPVKFLAEAEEIGYTTLVVESAIGSDDSYMADRRKILALNRSNGGATFIRDGQVVSKWTSRNLPSYKEMEVLMESDSAEIVREKKYNGSVALQGYILALLALFLVL